MMKTGAMKIMIGKYAKMFLVMLAFFSLGAGAQGTEKATLPAQQERIVQMPSSYDKDAILDYLSTKIPVQQLETSEQYISAMKTAIAEHIADTVWRRRFHCDFAIGLIEMTGTVENPVSHLEDYISTTPPDSLVSRARQSYDKVVAAYGRTYPGNPAPDFTFCDTSGKTLSLKSLRGKTLFIDIWGTWCVPCIEEMPFIEKLHLKYAQRSDVHIMSIACDKKAERWKNFLAKHPTPWHQYLVTPEGAQVLTDVYHVMGIPRFIIIDKNGNIVTSESMRPSEDAFAAYFEEIINKQ